MSASDFLRDQLAALKAAGCTKAKLTFEGSAVASIEVEFAEAPVSASPFRDKDGKPIDMDEGAGTLTKDPDSLGPAATDEPSDAALERANFRKKAG